MTFRKRPEERDTLGSMSKPIEASIVVVDDEPSIRELLVASLHFAGFEVNTAASGSEAIEVIEKVQPDLIVLDVMLPDIDGFTVTRRIRQEDINAPVLFLTARDDTQDKIMGLTVGVTITSPSRSASRKSWLASAPFCAVPANRWKTIRLFASPTWKSTRTPTT